MACFESVRYGRKDWEPPHSSDRLGINSVPLAPTQKRSFFTPGETVFGSDFFKVKGNDIHYNTKKCKTLDLSSVPCLQDRPTNGIQKTRPKGDH